MLFPKFFEQDKQLLRENISQLKQLTSQDHEFFADAKRRAREEGDDELARIINEFQGQMTDYCTRAVTTLDQIGNPGNTSADTQESYGLYLAVTVQSLQASTESLQERLIAAQATGQPVPQAPSPSSGQPTKQSLIQRIANWIRQHVVPILRQVLQGAWRILSNLLTPKGWKVKGSIGTSFLGLGSAELEIQFGK